MGVTRSRRPVGGGDWRYMAPENLRPLGNTTTPATLAMDMYAFGHLTYLAVTGELDCARRTAEEVLRLALQEKSIKYDWPSNLPKSLLVLREIAEQCVFWDP